MFDLVFLRRGTQAQKGNAMKFTHRDLNRFNRVLPGGSILQMVDPNDNSQTRMQITAVDDILFSRRLPAAEHGDIWRGDDAPPQWHAMVEVPPVDLVADWWQSQFTSWRPLRESYAKNNWEQWGIPLSQMRLSITKDVIETNVVDWPQAVSCPHCGNWILWHEDGYVPGHRSCRNGCHRHWQITRDSRAGHWTLENGASEVIWKYRLSNAQRNELLVRNGGLLIALPAPAEDPDDWEEWAALSLGTDGQFVVSATPDFAVVIPKTGVQSLSGIFGQITHSPPTGLHWCVEIVRCELNPPAKMRHQRGKMQWPASVIDERGQEWPKQSAGGQA